MAQGKKSVNSSNTPIVFACLAKILQNGQVTSPKINDFAIYSTYSENLRHESTLTMLKLTLYFICFGSP